MDYRTKKKQSLSTKGGHRHRELRTVMANRRERGEVGEERATSRRGTTGREVGVAIAAMDRPTRTFSPSPRDATQQVHKSGVGLVRVHYSQGNRQTTRDPETAHRQETTGESHSTTPHRSTGTQERHRRDTGGKHAARPEQRGERVTEIHLSNKSKNKANKEHR